MTTSINADGAFPSECGFCTITPPASVYTYMKTFDSNAYAPSTVPPLARSSGLMTEVAFTGWLGNAVDECLARSSRTGRNCPRPHRSALCPSCLKSAAPTAAPTRSRAAAPAAAASRKPDNEQQHDGAYGGVDDPTDNSHTKMQTESRHQPVADEGADHSDYHVADEAEAGPLDDLTCQPPGNQTNQ
jgi:hypothetical protein